VKVLPPKRREDEQEGRKGMPETQFPGSMRAAHRVPMLGRLIGSNRE
jgi:hypothetical protein